MSRLLVNKQTRFFSFLFIILILSTIYIFVEYRTIKKESYNYINKSLVLNYNIYLEILKKNYNLDSLIIENPNYFDSKEFIEEYKKTTPLFINKTNKHIPKFDLSFKYIKNTANKDKFPNQITILKNSNKEYIIKKLDDKQLILLGKANKQGFIQITLNIKAYKELLNSIDTFFFLVIISIFISFSFFIYVFTLRETLKETEHNLKQKYEELSEETKKVAFEDPLTKASSRLKFDETLKDLIQIASRFEEQKFCVIIMDIDNFKFINDNFGHDYGDLVLKVMAKEVKKYLRVSDTFARWGGEEFVILSPFININSAYIIAEKIRVLINQLEFDKLDSISCSFGVVEFKKGDTQEGIIKRADELLYKAKRNGKNRIEY